MGISERLCNVGTKILKFEKFKSTNSKGGGSDVCLVKVFSKAGNNAACRGYCNLCQSEVVGGKFTEESEGSTTPQSKEDIWGS